MGSGTNGVGCGAELRDQHAARHDDGCQCPECVDPTALDASSDECRACGSWACDGTEPHVFHDAALLATDDELLALAAYERGHSPAVLS